MDQDAVDRLSFPQTVSPHFCAFLTPSQAIADDRPLFAGQEPVELAAIRQMALYSRDFLMAKHPKLGRPGAVCPFLAGALQRNLLTITAYMSDSTEEDAVAEAIGGLRQQLIESGRADASGDRIFRSIIITFPFIPESNAPALIQAVQRKLKPDFLREGLMIGEFYPSCPAPGIHNAEFRPLQSPISAIAIRHMTPQDAPFMLQDPRHRELYEDFFGQDGRNRIQNLLDARIGCPVTQISGTDQSLVPPHDG